MFIIKTLRKFKRVCCSLKKYCEIKKIDSRKVIMFNTPEHSNLGDQALSYAENIFFKKNFPNIIYVEITGPELNVLYKLQLLKNLISNNDIICIHAGGYLGTLWIEEEERTRKVLTTFKNHEIFIFPQTVYYSNDTYGKEQLKISQNIYRQCCNLNIFAREKYSYKLLQEYFPKNNIFLVPDMVLYCDRYIGNNIRQGILLCLRNDKEKTQTYNDFIKKSVAYLNQDISNTDTISSTKKITSKNRKSEIEKKLDEFSKAKLIITDRLHGMIFATLTATPCIVILSQSHKVKGVYQWIKDLEYIELVEDMSDFSKAVNKVLSVKNPMFNNDAIKKEFKPLIKELEYFYGK